MRARRATFTAAPPRLAAQLYLPSYLDGSEWRTGRPWDALRLSRIWRLSLRYFSTRVTREARLDPAKQYVFAYHPHGILVMSRIFFYGGAWEALFPGVRCRVLGATPMFKVPACREVRAAPLRSAIRRSAARGCVRAARRRARRVTARSFAWR